MKDCELAREFHPVVDLAELIDFYILREKDQRNKQDKSLDSGDKVEKIINDLKKYRNQLIDYSNNQDQIMCKMREEVSMYKKTRDKLIKNIDTINSVTGIILLKYEEF